MNIADIKKLEHGATVPSVTGLVSEVKERRNVNGRRGLTTVQDIKLSQGNDFIWVIMWGRDDLSNLRGQEVKIANDRGLQVKEENFNNRAGQPVTVKKLQVGEHATITSPGWGTPEQPAAQPAPQQQQAPAQQSKSHLPQQATLRPMPDESGVKDRLNRMANLYLDCILATDYIAATKPLTPEHYQACVASLFITATREGLHEKMAAGKFNAPKPAPSPAPAPAAPTPPPARNEGPQMAFDPNEAGDDSHVPF